MNGIAIFLTTKCNLACKYCYLDHGLTEIDKKLETSLLNGSYAEKIKKQLSELQIPLENIKRLELWGLEPSLGFDNFIKSNFMSNFPNIQEIMFSTNGTVPIHNYFNFFKYLKETNENIKIGFQISLDGPNFILKNRDEKLTSSRIISTLYDIVSIVKQLDLEMKIALAPTSTLYNLASLNEKDWNKINTFWFTVINNVRNFAASDKIHVQNSLAFALEYPMNYSKQDGEIFFEHLKTYYKAQEKFSYPITIKPTFCNLVKKPFNVEGTSINSNCPIIEQRAITFDHEGNFVICHRALDFHYSENNKITLKDAHEYLKELLDTGSEVMIDTFVYALQYFIKLNLISEDYLHDEEKLYHHAYICSQMKACCTYDSFIYTKDCSVPTTYYMAPLLMNGYLDLLLEKERDDINAK